MYIFGANWPNDTLSSTLRPSLSGTRLLAERSMDITGDESFKSDVHLWVVLYCMCDRRISSGQTTLRPVLLSPVRLSRGGRRRQVLFMCCMTIATISSLHGLLRPVATV